MNNLNCQSFTERRSNKKINCNITFPEVKLKVCLSDSRAAVQTSLSVSLWRRIRLNPSDSLNSRISANTGEYTELHRHNNMTKYLVTNEQKTKFNICLLRATKQLALATVNLPPCSGLFQVSTQNLSSCQTGWWSWRETVSVSFNFHLFFFTFNVSNSLLSASSSSLSVPPPPLSLPPI